MKVTRKSSKLLRHPRIAKELQRWQAATLKKHTTIAERVVETMAQQAFTTIGDFYDAKGNLIPLQDLEHGPAQALKKYRRRELWEGRARNRQRVGEVVEIELVDKMAALRALGQHFGLFAERVHADNDDALVRAMREARERARLK